MKIIKRKILLENSIDRTNNSLTWGSITANTFSFNIFLTQNIDDMGMFTDLDYTKSYTAETYSNLTSTDLLTLRLQSKTESDYFNYKDKEITGYTDTKLEELMSYNENDRYIAGFDIETDDYIDYKNNLINGVSRVTSNLEPIVYVFDSNLDQNIGTDNQNTGILYKDYSDLINTINIDGEIFTIPLTEFKYIGQGLNETNTSLSALTKQEFLMGVISKPEIENDVFIERGTTSVFDLHLKMSEIKNISELTRYGNNFFNIRRV